MYFFVLGTILIILVFGLDIYKTYKKEQKEKEEKELRKQQIEYYKKMNENTK